jgi:hypothetical protein
LQGKKGKKKKGMMRSGGFMDLPQIHLSFFSFFLASLPRQACAETLAQPI